MEGNKFYSSPILAYGYKDLEPYMSEEQLKIHVEKHHQTYIKGANAILEKMEKARKEGSDLDMKSTLKELSFNIGGHLLHSLFWGNMASASEDTNPRGNLSNAIDSEFGSYERFKKEFTQTAVSVEGSGWAALSYCKQTQRLLIMQIEKHNVNIYPMFRILMVLDVFEHAYYLDYKNERAKFVDAFWHILNWKEVEKRFTDAQ